MSVTLNELVIRTLQRIDERYNSTTGEVGTGTGSILQVDSGWVVVGSGGTQRTTVESIKDYLNQAQEEWFTTAGYLEGTLSILPPTWGAGVAAKLLHDLPFAPGSGLASLWAVNEVLRGTALLKRTTPGDLERNAPGYVGTSSGTPGYWYQVQSTLRLYPAPSAAPSLVLSGLALPERLSGSVNCTALRDDDARRILPLIAAILLLRRKFTAPEQFGRLEELVSEYQDLYSRHRSRIDPDIVQRHYRDPLSELQPKR